MTDRVAEIRATTLDGRWTGATYAAMEELVGRLARAEEALRQIADWGDVRERGQHRPTQASIARDYFAGPKPTSIRAMIDGENPPLKKGAS